MLLGLTTSCGLPQPGKANNDVVNGNFDRISVDLEQAKASFEVTNANFDNIEARLDRIEASPGTANN